jgi:hypothetical protein
LVDKCPYCARTLARRSLEQNAKLHALLSDIAEQATWAGQRLDVEDWKRLMTSAWERANGGHVRIFPSLDGSGMDILYRRTSRMTKQEMSELIEYATAWAVSNGVVLHDEHEMAVA